MQTPKLDCPPLSHLNFNVLLCEGNVRDAGRLGDQLGTLHALERLDREGVHPLLLLPVPHPRQRYEPATSESCVVRI